MTKEPTSSSGERYAFVREIAQGGMGRVLLAVRQEGAFRRVYAIKRLREVYRDDPDVRRMFMDEARIAGLLRHPNVVGVLDIGEDLEGPYLVMDFIEGLSLAQVVEVVRAEQKLLPVQVCVRIFKQVAEGLHIAHELRGSDGQFLNLVHRDVSPQNILVGFDGVARVTDFGIAKALGRVGKTSTGLIKGKSGYLSPEQLAFRDPDRRSDLFSLGIVIYEALTSTRLYGGGGGDLAKVARRILDEPPPDVHEVRNDVHPLLVELLFQLLSKDRDYRPNTAREVARRLEEILTDLVLEDGALTVTDYLAEHFADRRDEIHKSMQEVRTASAVAGPVTLIPIHVDDEAFADTKSSGRRAKSPWLGYAAAMATGLIVALGGVLLWDQLAGVEPEEPQTVVSEDRQAAPEFTVVPPPVERPAEPEPVPVEPETTEEPVDEVRGAAVAEEAAADARQRARARAALRARRAQTDESPMQTAPSMESDMSLWMWDR